MQFTTLLAFALASVGLSYATAIAADSEYIPVAYAADASIAKRAGCGSSGPLGDGHYEWYIVVSCTPGDV